MTRKPLCEFLVASCVKDGGVYRFRLYEDGGLEVRQKLPMPSPMYLQLEANRLWSVLRAPFSDSKQSDVAAWLDSILIALVLAYIYNSYSSSSHRT